MKMMSFIQKSSHLTTFGISFKNFLTKVHSHPVLWQFFRLWFFGELPKCKSLRTINIEDTNLAHYKFIDAEFEFILKMPNLTEFKLSSVIIYAEQFDPLFQLITKSHLESFHLSLREGFLGDINLMIDAKFFSYFEQNKTLTKVDIPQLSDKNQAKLQKIIERNKNFKLQMVSLDDDYEEMSNPMPKRSSGAKKHSKHIYDMDYITKVSYYIDLLIYNDQFVRNNVQKQKLKKIYNLLLSELYTFTKSSKTSDDYDTFVDHTSYIINDQLNDYRNKYTLYHKQ